MGSVESKDGVNQPSPLSDSAKLLRSFIMKYKRRSKRKSRWMDMSVRKSKNYSGKQLLKASYTAFTCFLQSLCWAEEDFVEYMIYCLLRKRRKSRRNIEKSGESLLA